MNGARRSLRIAILCHSVNPRGGVVHALELAEALAALGHEPVVHAPDPAGAGFFRETGFETVSVPARPVQGSLADLVEARVGDYVAHFQDPAKARFDVFHAQDGISGNALATLRDRRQAPAFARTAHHLDVFDDPRLDALQKRSIATAGAQYVVSRLWRDRLRVEFGLEAIVVGNGVDLRRFTPTPDGREATLRQRLQLGAGPVVLAVGGVERRKNTARILEAFSQVHRIHSGARLIVAGGASLLDHSDYHAEFARMLAASGPAAEAVTLLGPVADDDMPALYRIADVLAFPSVAEGFGLVTLEAMACGLPAVVSHIPPFTEYLDEGDAAWCDPLNPSSIANAVMAALSEPLRSRLAASGFEAAARHGWREVALAHLPEYERLTEPALA
ncbi:MAG: MSMEG_0565 family glycosyltransferase [Hansschlegelia sp.]